MARDSIHDAVCLALEKDGWIITEDPYYLESGGVEIEIANGFTMEKLANYNKIVRNILETLAARIPANLPTIEKRLIADEKRHEYILVSLGRRDKGHYYNVLAHIEIKDGKVIIHQESVDPTFYERLTDAGIPESDILPVYMPDFEWEHAAQTAA